MNFIVTVVLRVIFNVVFVAAAETMFTLMSTSWLEQKGCVVEKIACELEKRSAEKARHIFVLENSWLRWKTDEMVVNALKRATFVDECSC